MRAALWPQALDEHPDAVDAFLSGESGLIDEALVCETESGELVGFLELRVRNYAEGTDSLAVPYVEGWYVDPDYRLRGVGASLISHAGRWARESGHAELASDTEIGNVDSIAAHCALGFEVTDKIVCFLKKL
jgi:aminoglycoside 6'-N-acetyltransferase I